LILSYWLKQWQEKSFNQDSQSQIAHKQLKANNNKTQVIELFIFIVAYLAQSS